MDFDEVVQRFKGRTSISVDELNEVVPQEDIASEDIEALMWRLSEAGIAVTEASEPRPLDPANQDELRETIDRVLASLTPEEERVLRSRFQFSDDSRLTIEQIDRQFSMTRERIRKIEEKALRKLGKGNQQQEHRYAFRPVAADDLTMIAAWLRRPHVARWWSDPAEQIETLRDNLSERTFEALVLLLDDRPVGSLQIYDASPGTTGATADQPPGTRGLDLFIGEPWALGAGHGPAFLHRITTRLLSDPGVLLVIADPDPDNERSLRCFEKAGFRRERVIEQPSGPAILMVSTKGDLG